MERKTARFCAHAYAKVNLSLAVTGKRGNMHTLDMIVCPLCAYRDEATLSPCEDKTTDEENTLALKSASASFDGFDYTRFEKFFAPKLDAISRELGVTGDVHIKKGIPLGAGLGGSSAAIVAVIRAAEQYLASKGESHSPSTEFLLSLGSDVPCMYAGVPCRVQGVGEIVTPLKEQTMPAMSVVIPACSSDSAACYALYDELLAKNAIPHRDNIPASVDEALTLLRNDLTLPATILEPKIARLLDELRKEHKSAIMSGSGSAIVVFL